MSTPREIRDRLLALPEADRLTVYLRLVEAGSEDVFFAIVKTLEFFEIVPPDAVVAFNKLIRLTGGAGQLKVR